MKLTAQEIATKVGGELDGPSGIVVHGLGDLRGSKDSDATFISDANYARLWKDCKAQVALVSRGVEVPDHNAKKRALIHVDRAEVAMISLLEHFSPPPESPPKGIHPTAVVETTTLSKDHICIGALVWIGKDCVLGKNVVIHSGARIYPGVTIGDDAIIHANAVIRERCELGKRVIVHAGAVIGTEGFGYRPCPNGNGLLRIPHIGNVVLEDDVEIGSCTCIDRGTFGSTRIGVGTKIDNHCQIGHNVQIGRSTVMAGLSGIAGSSTVGDWVRIGAGSGIADHRTVGTGAQLAARTALMNDVPAGEVWGGMPAREIKIEMRHILALQKLSPLTRDLMRLVDETKKNKEAAKESAKETAQP